MDDLSSYLSLLDVRVTVPRQLDCGPLFVTGHLYALPSYHPPLGPMGHTVKHFLIQCQDSWQITFFLLTGTRNYALIYWSRSKNAHRGVQREQSTMWNSCCVVFWSLQANPAVAQKQSGFSCSILGRCPVAVNLTLCHFSVFLADLRDYCPRLGLSENISTHHLLHVHWIDWSIVLDECVLLFHVGHSMRQNRKDFRICHTYKNT